MADFSSSIIPLMIGGILAYGMFKKVNVFEVFLEGAAQGLKVVVSILPALILLLTAVTMFQASGAMDVFVWAVSPVANFLGIPKEVLPLALMRPVSGSGGMVLYNQILTDHGPDSYLGRIASVIQGSTETTFYTIAVYYGATRIKDTRHTLCTSLAGDFTGIYFSVITVTWLLTTV